MNRSIVGVAILTAVMVLFGGGSAESFNSACCAEFTRPTAAPQPVPLPPVEAAINATPPPIKPTQMVVPDGLRVVVFSPHPDDEALGASGLLQRVWNKDGQVRVVYFTNGDGYTEAVQRAFKRTRTSSKDFIAYGQMRQDEAVQSLCALGFDQEDGIFLGFPDDGIDDLWSTYWYSQNPYTSPYTRSDHVPYTESFSSRVRYAGVDLKGQIERMLRNFTPDWVVIPDPRDMHPDHSAAGMFVLDAIRELKQEEPQFASTRVYTYLIHYKDCPFGTEWTREIARADVSGSRTLGRFLSTTQWYALTLTPDEREGKEHALDAYQSQIQPLGWFFKLFQGPTEYFGLLDMGQILAVPVEYAASHHRPISGPSHPD